jgi:hypothetical protein
MTRAGIHTLSFLMLFAMTGHSAAQSKCPDSFLNVEVTVLAACIRDLETKIGELRRPAIPAGAVMAFDLPGGCPADGWEPYDSAASRMIVGALPDGRDTSSSDQPKLTPRRYQARGGTESHILTIGQMPEHTHQFRGVPVKTGGWGFPVNNWPVATGGAGEFQPYTPQGEISSAGGKEPVNNMPPFIALHYCRKK